ncbi:leucine-rich repeat domain-containing protein [Listeria costaricensis]|uniref:leucine-rich repeat domain-containing protein n=1 Tax=Listeria costaricensis TaxID=2026604 RepID=UPI000C06D70E|nr:leucine-rich repeat domain-containing protein [Listeria costaricensis]
MNNLKCGCVFKKKWVLTMLLMVAVLCLTCPSTGSAMYEEAGEDTYQYDEKGQLIAAPFDAIFPDIRMAIAVAKTLGMGPYDSVSLDLLKGIEDLDLENCHIKSLEGIENLTGLKKLNCCRNDLINIDISKNKELVELDCSRSKLQHLDVSENKKLVELDCSANKLEKLQLDLPNLKILDVAGTMITELDTSNLPLLTHLDVGFCSKIKTLNLIKNPMLEKLSFMANMHLEGAILHKYATERGVKFVCFTS